MQTKKLTFLDPIEYVFKEIVEIQKKEKNQLDFLLHRDSAIVVSFIFFSISCFETIML